MHDSYMNYVFLCMPWTDWWERKQSTLHRKLYWIIRVGFYSFLLKQKVDKIKFLSTNAHLASRAEPPCLFKELIYAICSQIFRFALAYSAKIYRSHTYDIHMTYLRAIALRCFIKRCFYQKFTNYRNVMVNWVNFN